MDLKINKVSNKTSVITGVSPDASPLRKQKIKTAFAQIIRQVTTIDDAIDLDDAVDIDYKHKGAHYKQYSDDKKLVQDSRQELNNFLEEVDDKIMNKIHENEQAYRKVV